jgi:hypothetical protein
MIGAGTCSLGLMAAWGPRLAIPLDIAARRGNTPVGCHSNTKRLLEEAERTPGVRVGYRLGSMGQQPLAGTHSHRGSHRHRVSSIRPSMAPNTAPSMARGRCRYPPEGLPTIRPHAIRPRGLRLHATRPRGLRLHARPATPALAPRLPRAAPPTGELSPPTSSVFPWSWPFLHHRVLILLGRIHRCFLPLYPQSPRHGHDRGQRTSAA